MEKAVIFKSKEHLQEVRRLEGKVLNKYFRLFARVSFLGLSIFVSLFHLTGHEGDGEAASRRAWGTEYLCFLSSSNEENRANVREQGSASLDG